MIYYTKEKNKSKEKEGPILVLDSIPLGGPGSGTVSRFSYWNRVWNQQKSLRVWNWSRYLETSPGPVWFRPGAIPFATLGGCTLNTLD